MSIKKRALIFGVSGQDGAYLSLLLINKGYEVWGTSRDAQLSKFENLNFLGIRSAVKTISVAPNDFKSVVNAVKLSRPHEIYNLSGQSSVGLSFEQAAETFESIVTVTLNILEVIRMLESPVKFYNAGSSECFGNVLNEAADENTQFRPCSPYAVAKSSAYWLVSSYRSAYDLFACTGILFNHESPCRPSRFVTQKIISTVIEISEGRVDKLTLGNISIQRDWGWSPEYVDAMWRMLQQSKAEDFVIATGQVNTLQDFVSTAFEYFGLNWRDYVIEEKSFFRPSEILYSCGNPLKAKVQLGWEPETKMRDVVLKMISARLSKK